jgi:hypothetical protein
LKEGHPVTGHVIDTAPPRRLDGIVRDPALRAAIGYWDSLRGARCLPARMDLDPGMLRPHLQDAAILEVAGPGSLRIRLGGARINALLGMDVRGLPLRALFDLSERARVSDRVEEAIGNARLLILDVVSPAPRFGRPEDEALRAQIAILPMTDVDLAPTRALYVMGPLSGEPRKADAPHRWCVPEIRELPLRAGEPVLRDAPLLSRAAPRPPVPLGTMDETASEERGPMARARFRVIDGGLA